MSSKYNLHENKSKSLMKKKSSNIFNQNKKTKLQKINSNLRSKLNDLLNDVENQEKIENIPYNPSKNDYANKILPIIIPKNINNQLPKINPQNKIPPNPNTIPAPKKNITDAKNVKKNLKKLKNASFMTGVGLVKSKKEVPIEKKLENDPYLQNINNQINSMLNNIDNIDDMDKETKVKNTIKHLKDSTDFMNLIKEVDDYSNEIHEEFDEVKYLIKFADNTHKLIDRHKNVMTNIFKRSGIRARGLENEDKKTITKATGNKSHNKEEEDYGNEPYYKNGYYYREPDEDLNLGEVFDKLKAINKVKDNLSNIQDDFLGYHHNLKTKMKEKKK